MIDGAGKSQRGSIFSQGFQTFKNFTTHLPSITDLKSNKAVLNRLGFKVVASGAEKHVVLPKIPLRTSGVDQPEKVYYVPVRIGFISKETALRRERAKMEDIKEKSGDFSHLAVESREVQKEERLGGKYTLEVDRAHRGDFESVIRDREKKPLSLTERMKLGQDYAKGMAQLHSTGYAYGDCKPENNLVFEVDGKPHLKIADFGKAEIVGEGSKPYRGNLRFAPPEGTLSKKGDVYSAALVLIRSVEEAYLNEKGDPLLPVMKEWQEPVSALPKRRGIEQYIVNNKAFPGLDEPSLTDKVFRRLPRMAKLEKAPEWKKGVQNGVLHAYIDKLGSKMLEEGSIKPEQVEAFKNLLKSMVAVNPADRPDMSDVAKELENIFGPTT